LEGTFRRVAHGPAVPGEQGLCMRWGTFPPLPFPLYIFSFLLVPEFFITSESGLTSDPLFLDPCLQVLETRICSVRRSPFFLMLKGARHVSPPVSVVPEWEYFFFGIRPFHLRTYPEPLLFSYPLQYFPYVSLFLCLAFFLKEDDITGLGLIFFRVLLSPPLPRAVCFHRVHFLDTTKPTSVLPVFRRDVDGFFPCLLESLFFASSCGHSAWTLVLSDT